MGISTKGISSNRNLEGLKPQFDKIDQVRETDEEKANSMVNKLTEGDKDLYSEYVSSKRRASTEALKEDRSIYPDLPQKEKVRLADKLTEDELNNYAKNGIIDEDVKNETLYKRKNAEDRETIVELIRAGKIDEATALQEGMMARQEIGIEDANKAFERGDEKRARELKRTYSSDPVKAEMSVIKTRNTKKVKELLENNPPEDVKEYFDSLSDIEKTALRKTLKRKANKFYLDKMNKIYETL